MIAVVTGGSGFIGRNLVTRLLRDGHEVRCLVRPSGGAAPQGAKRFVVHLQDQRSLENCAAFDGAHVVFHLAAATKAVREEDFVAANVVPTRNLLNALTARGLYPKIVHVSSQAAAGPARDWKCPITEDDAPRPVEAYGRSKLEGERVAIEMSDHLPITIVRPCSTLGPYDRDFLILFRMAERGVVLYPGTADHWLSVLHVDDVVDGLLAATQRDTSIPRTFFLSSREPIQWRTLGAYIAAATGRRATQVNVHASIVRTAALAGEWIGRLTQNASLANASKVELSRHPYWVCSGRRAEHELQFRETRSLPMAIRDT